MSIIVPKDLAEREFTERFGKAVLGAVEAAGAEGLPVSRLRRFALLGMPPHRIQQLENRLVREGILILKADRLYLAPIENIRAFLARSGWMDSQVVAIAPEAPSGGQA